MNGTQISLTNLHNSSFSSVIPNLQVVWDSTSLGLLKECPRKYYYQMIAQRSSIGTSHHITFGAHFHAALWFYHQRRAEGLSFEQAQAATIKHALTISWGWASLDSLKNRENLIRAVFFYLENWKNDPAETYILASGKPAVELTFKFNLGIEAPSGESYMLSGHLDRVVMHGQKLWVIDYKTTGQTLSGKYFERYSPDNQVSLYHLAGKIGFAIPISGVMIDGVQLLVEAARFARAPAYRDEGMIEEWYKELPYWLNQARAFAEAGHWPANDKSCFAYGGCPFRNVCMLNPQMRGKYLLANYEKHVWNPAENR
jgi:hypothetical protein